MTQPTAAALRRFRARLDSRFLRRHYCPWPCQRMTVLAHTHTAAAIQAPEWRGR